MDPTHIDSQPVLSRVAKCRFLETEKKEVVHQRWRRVGEARKLDNPIGQDSGPSAQVGECDSSKPTTRSINSSGKEYFMPPATQSANNQESPPSEEDKQDNSGKDKPRKLVAAIPEVCSANCEQTVR